MIDVAIAGGGPVGMLLAAELALQGVRPVVFEKLAAPTGESKAGTLHTRVGQLLDRRGLLDQAGRATYGTVGFHFSGMFGLRLSAADGPAIVGSPQAWAERVFAERAVSLGARIRRGHEITGLVQHAGHVTLTAGGHQVDARYVVGADGARSAVRRAAGIDFQGTGARVAALMGEVRLGPGVPGGWHRTPRGWLMIWPDPHGHSRVTTYDFRGPHPDREAPVTLDELRQAASRIAGRPIEMSDARSLSRYGDAALQAASYRDRRVLLAGDAAHVHFPWGGQGLNTSLEDAMNLGWKLAAVVHGHAPEHTLDSYHAERHPVAARVLWNVRAQNALAHPDPALDPLRELFAELMELEPVNDYLTGMISGQDIRYDVGVDGAGWLAPDLRIKTGDGEVGLAGLLRQGRACFVDLAGRDDLVEVVGERVPVVRGVAESEHEALLVRPDGYVAWAAPSTARELDAAIDRWFVAPQSSRPSSLLR
ncbi:FAD-dependent monooxygenase [Nonomuraea soli]|uniref:Monooxygenase n=1 Tax=Nonomuraea soli TaxID=1032476 RepID=A0A7W0HSY5_9ACTN|nr:FAD-dependent monooxygenase [Nonomuraea soli]MBA2894490.1 monooxygenase [Nonomuraea soli]